MVVMTANRATAIGATAILMWATLALLATYTTRVPPFQLTAMAFALAFALACAKWALFRQHPLTRLRQPPAAWALGVAGLFGYHLCYFLALRLAPPVEANLVNYMWPLLIVLFSGLLPGHRLGWAPVAGAMAGLVGTAMLVTRDGGLSFQGAHAAGYMAAMGAAVIWAGYSVLSRRFAEVPTDTVGGFCGASALLAGVCHLLLERTVAPTAAEWLAIAAMGCGPVGAAFFVWDLGIKRGDIRALGLLSYATPLLSTLLLIAFGRAGLTPLTVLAGALIIGGALVGNWRGRPEAAPAATER